MKTAFFATAAAVVILSGMTTTARAFDVFLPSVSMPADPAPDCDRGVCVSKGS